MGYANWVHGTAFMPPEFPTQGLDNVDGVPYTDVVGLRRGWGTFWQGKTGNANWFHVSIPTPVIIDNARVKLQRVFVMFTAETQPSTTRTWPGRTSPISTSGTGSI